MAAWGRKILRALAAVIVYGASGQVAATAGMLILSAQARAGFLGLLRQMMTSPGAFLAHTAPEMLAVGVRISSGMLTGAIVVAGLALLSRRSLPWLLSLSAACGLPSGALMSLLYLAMAASPREPGWMQAALLLTPIPCLLLGARWRSFNWGVRPGGPGGGSGGRP